MPSTSLIRFVRWRGRHPRRRPSHESLRPHGRTWFRWLHCVSRLAGAVALFASCNAPSQQDMQTVQALTELGDSFNDLRLVQQELQDQVDSLRQVVARQDSVVRTLANLAGVVMPPR